MICDDPLRSSCLSVWPPEAEPGLTSMHGSSTQAGGGDSQSTQQMAAGGSEQGSLWLRGFCLQQTGSCRDEHPLLTLTCLTLHDDDTVCRFQITDNYFKFCLVQWQREGNWVFAYWSPPVVTKLEVKLHSLLLVFLFFLHKEKFSHEF